jgi:hypothetical protein
MGAIKSQFHFRTFRGFLPTPWGRPGLTFPMLFRSGRNCIPSHTRKKPTRLPSKSPEPAWCDYRRIMDRLGFSHQMGITDGITIRMNGSILSAAGITRKATSTILCGLTGYLLCSRVEPSWTSVPNFIIPCRLLAHPDRLFPAVSKRLTFFSSLADKLH